MDCAGGWFDVVHRYDNVIDLAWERRLAEINRVFKYVDKLFTQLDQQNWRHRSLGNVQCQRLQGGGTD